MVRACHRPRYRGLTRALVTFLTQSTCPFVLSCSVKSISIRPNQAHVCSVSSGSGAQRSAATRGELCTSHSLTTDTSLRALLSAPLGGLSKPAMRAPTPPAMSRPVTDQTPCHRADYNSRRSGGQEENHRRRANGHQMPLSARVPSRSGGRDARDDGGATLRTRFNKGVTYMNASRRRGRPAHQRSPDDSPLRDGNRDRLIGLLTKRAAKTLEYYFMETNLTYHHWLSVRAPPPQALYPSWTFGAITVCEARGSVAQHRCAWVGRALTWRARAQEYMRQNPIPQEGSWDAVSGEEFLRKLLVEGVDQTRYTGGVRDPLFSNVGTIGIDPRALGQRIMDIRTALAAEFIQARPPPDPPLPAERDPSVIRVAARAWACDFSLHAARCIATVLQRRAWRSSDRGPRVQDLEAVAEENAILMRECAMASLSALESTDAGDSPITPHPEMLDELPTRIPDTASEFLATVNESGLERYQRERGLEGGGAQDALADIDDAVRPGARRRVRVPAASAFGLDQRRAEFALPP